MTRPSARARANRLNAQRSTGPKSAEGKARVAQNARVHGFRSAKRAEVTPQVERFARRIAGPDADPERLALAREIAASDEIVRRARRARLLLPKKAPEFTIQDLARLGKEFERAFDLDARFAQYRKMSEEVYKGRPRKIDNYPRFRGLLKKLEDLPLRTALALMTPEPSEDEPMFLPQARALARYEAEAMRRRSRAIVVFDAYCG